MERVVGEWLVLKCCDSTAVCKSGVSTWGTARFPQVFVHYDVRVERVLLKSCVYLGNKACYDFRFELSLKMGRVYMPGPKRLVAETTGCYDFPETSHNARLHCSALVEVARGRFFPVREPFSPPFNP